MNRSINETRAEAEEILAKMNEMLRYKPAGKVLGEDRFWELNDKIHELGWLALFATEKLDAFKLVNSNHRYYI
jgi:hypothetical protein